ncbi:MAG: glycosyltransferase [Candidatus Sericytochromatia bacterium]
MWVIKAKMNTNSKKHIDLIVFSTGEWSFFHRRSLLESVSASLFKDDQMVVLNRPIDLMTSWWRHPGKLKLGSALLAKNQNPPYLLFRPILPIHDQLAYRNKYVSWINSKLLLINLKKILRSDAKRVLWVMHPSFFHYAKELNPDLLIYDCYDEYVEFAKPSRIGLIRDLEQEILKKADLTIFAAKYVMQKKVQFCSNPYYLPNPVNMSLMSQARNKNLLVPQDLYAIPEPRVMYIGGVKALLDEDLICFLAKNNPNISFVFIGKVEPLSPFANLEKEPNIYFLGFKPISQLPAYLSGAKLGLVPYKINDLVRNINPNKVMDYLAAGIEVVSTEIPELIGKYPQYIHVGKDKEEINLLLQTCLSRDSRIFPDSELKLNSQEYHCDKLVNHIHNLLN